MIGKKIALSAPRMGGREKEYVGLALDSYGGAPAGCNVAAFEGDLEKYLGGGCHVAALASGTSALHLGLVLLGIRAGDEVVCQSMTFCASVNPILYQGATPVFVDSEEDTWNLCPAALERAILDRIGKGRKPKAIIAVHLYGMPYNVDAINDIACRYGIPVLEDCAEALGSRYRNQRCGTFGNIAAISFNRNKIVTTAGGGAIIAKSAETKEKAIFLSTQSRDDAPHYQHSEVGYNYRMGSISAAVGRGQMEYIEEWIRLRRAMHSFYLDFFRDMDGVVVFTEPNGDYYSNHWLSAIVLDPKKLGGKTREDLRLALERAGIESRPLWKPMHLQPIFEGYPYYGGRVAEELFENGLCLPSGPGISVKDRERIEAALRDFFSSFFPS